MKEKAYLGDFSQVKEKIFAWVVNRDFYDALLEKVPHRDFLDLSVVYSLVLEDDPERLCLIMVWNEQLEQWGVDEETLYQNAMKNTFEEMRPRVSTLGEALHEISEALLDAPQETDMLEGRHEEIVFYVIWNKAGRFGANVLLHPEILERLAERIEDDFYILPSSMDEVLAVPTRRNMSAKELAEIVCTVNESNLPPEEQLSNQVYFYKRGSGEVVMAV